MGRRIRRGFSGALLNFNTLPGAQFSFGATSGTGGGQVVLTAATTITATVNGDSLRKLFFANKTYANIHTTTNSPGEIRGEVRRRPVNASCGSSRRCSS